MKNLFSALIKARSEIQNLYPGKSGYGYKYVDLSQIVDMLKEVLPKFGLGYLQLPTSNDPEICGLKTIVFHESGESIEDTILFKPTNMKGVNLSQAIGASLTYFRRYALCAAFGITGDEDTDAVVQPQQKTAKSSTPTVDKTAITARMKELIQSGVFNEEEVELYRGRLKTEDWNTVLSDMENAYKIKTGK